MRENRTTGTTTAEKVRFPIVQKKWASNLVSSSRPVFPFPGVFICTYLLLPYMAECDVRVIRGKGDDERRCTFPYYATLLMEAKGKQFKVKVCRKHYSYPVGKSGYRSAHSTIDRVHKLTVYDEDGNIVTAKLVEVQSVSYEPNWERREVGWRTKKRHYYDYYQK